MNKLRLESVMKLHGDTGGSLAEFLGITRGTFSQKLNEKGTSFTQREITLIKQRYNLGAEDVDGIFFDFDVSK